MNIKVQIDGVTLCLPDIFTMKDGVEKLLDEVFHYCQHGAGTGYEEVPLRSMVCASPVFCPEGDRIQAGRTLFRVGGQGFEKVDGFLTGGQTLAEFIDSRAEKKVEAAAAEAKASARLSVDDLIELERQRQATAKAQLEAKTAARPKEEKKSKAAATAEKRLKADIKPNGVPLLEEYAYLGKNTWLHRINSNWVGAIVEYDSAVVSSVKKAGYGTLEWQASWEDDPILKTCPARTTQTELEAVLDYMRTACAINGRMQAANYPHGLMEIDGERILNQGTYMPMSHPACRMPDCWFVYTQGLFLGQRDRVLALVREWLKAIQGGDALARGWFQPLVLALVSPSGGKGKGRFIHFCARMAGAAISEPLGKYIEGDDIGASVKLQAPVVDMSDSHIGANKAAKQLKFMKLVTEEVKDIRRMHIESVSIPLSPLVMASLNNETEAAQLFQGMSSVLKEKCMVVRCTDGTRALSNAGYTYDDLERTLPQFVGWLLSTRTAPKYKMELIDGDLRPARFLVGHYFDEQLALEWGPLGHLAPVLDDLLEVVEPDKWYKVGEIVQRLATLHLEGAFSRSMYNYTPQTMSTDLEKIWKACPDVVRRCDIGAGKSAGGKERHVHKYKFVFQRAVPKADEKKDPL